MANSSNLLAIFALILTVVHSANFGHMIEQLLPRVTEYFEEVVVLIEPLYHEIIKESSAGNPARIAIASEAPCHVGESLRYSRSSTVVIVCAPNQTVLQDWILKLAQLSSSRTQNFFYFILWSEDWNGFKSVAKNLSTSFRLDSNVYWLVRTLQDRMLVWESYSVKRMGIVQRVPEDWDAPLLPQRLVGSKWQRRRDFRREAVIATAAKDEVYSEEVKLTKDSMGREVLDNSIGVDIYRIYRDHLNFSESVVEGAYILELSPPAGIERMHVHLASGKADIAIPLSVIEENKAYFAQFLHPVATSWLEMRFVDSMLPWRFLAGPFEVAVWRLIFYQAIAQLIAITTFRWFLKITANENGVLNTLSLDSLWSLGSLCSQGWFEWPQSTPLKVLFIFAAITGFVLNVSYSGGLTAQLSVRRPTKFTLEKLLNSKYSFYLEDDVSFPIDLQDFPQWHDIRVRTLSGDTEAFSALRALSEGKVAWVSFHEYYRRITQKANYSEAEACRLSSAIRPTSVRSLQAMAVNKTSEFKEVLNVLTARLAETGILFRLYRKYKQGCILVCEERRGPSTPTLPELSLAFGSIAMGTLAACLVLIAELVTHLVKDRVSLGRILWAFSSHNFINIHSF